MEIWHGFVYLILTVITAIYILFKYKFQYWSKRGIPYIEPKIPFGNIQGIGRKLHSSQLMQKFYNEMKGKLPFGGIYFFIKPSALIIDLDLVKNILIKDFHYFHDRGMYYNEKDDPLSAHLFSLDGQKWKVLRSKLTPTFTSGKMKFMFPTIVQVCEQFQAVLKEIAIKNDEIELKDILARFTTDVIGTCAFGIDCNSLKDPDADFRRMGKKVFEVPRNIAIKQIFMVTFRNLSKKLGLRSTHEDVSRFFMKIVQETVEYREKNKIERNDFMDLLIKLKNGKSLDTEDATGSLTLEEIAAQAFVFFLAGFETSSTTMSYCLYELALHQDIQEKARKLITDTLTKHDGNFTYEAMMEMTYIDQIINESLRKYPPGANLIRRTNKDYNVPGTNKIIENGTTIWIPVYAIHHDPDIYPEPEKFDPDRFTSEAIKSRHSCSFLAFGDGPRNCIGLRFGMLQARIGLIMLLQNFKFTKCSKTTVPLTFSTRSVVLSPVGGLWLHVEPISKIQ